MKHPFLLWQRWLRTVVAVVLSAQFWGIAPLVIFVAGCISPEVPESVQGTSPHVYRRKICVVPPSLPPETKVFATDANRSVFVSDRDADAYQKFLPQAETIFEYDIFARPSSALLLGIGMRLSCPEQFEVLRPVDDVDEGESRIVRVVRIPTQTHEELSTLVEQTCKTAAADGLNKRYVGQELGHRKPFFLGVGNEEFQRQVRHILGIERIPEHEPSGPPGVLEQLRKTHTGQEIVGAGRGITKAVIPGGTIAVDLGRQAHWLEEGTRTERITEACFELGVGVGQIVLGCGGMGVGTGLTGTGGGAPAGAVVFVGSLGLTMTGVANCGNAVRHLTIELWRADDGDGLSSSPPSQSTEAAPQASKPPAAPTPQAPKAEPAKLEPYKQGGGHHVPAKKAFEGAPGYDLDKAPAIPKTELEKLGVNHRAVTGFQRTAYIDFAKTGQPLTWEAIAKIEIDALVKGKMKLDMAEATVAKAIQSLKDAGVKFPVRIPWKTK